MDLQGFRGLQEAYDGVYVDLNESSIQNEDLDLYDLILSHLMDEGYANTPEAAEIIMENMSEGWKTDVLKSVGSTTMKAGRRVAKALNNSNRVKRFKKGAKNFAINTALGALTGIPLE